MEPLHCILGHQKQTLHPTQRRRLTHPVPQCVRACMCVEGMYKVCACVRVCVRVYACMVHACVCVRWLPLSPVPVTAAGLLGRCHAAPLGCLVPVDDDGSLRGLLAHLLRCDVVPQGVEGPADEGGLPIKDGSPGGEALGRGPQQPGPQSLPQRLSQSGLPCDER